MPSMPSDLCPTALRSYTGYAPSGISVGSVGAFQLGPYPRKSWQVSMYPSSVLDVPAMLRTRRAWL